MNQSKKQGNRWFSLWKKGKSATLRQRLKQRHERLAMKLQVSLELKSFLINFCVIVVPLLVILSLMTHLFLSNYGKREMDTIRTSVEKSIERMDSFVLRLNSATIQLAGNDYLRADRLRKEPLAFGYVRDLLTYINNANNLWDVAFYSPGTPELFYTTMGTFNREYYKQYLTDDGRVLPALEAFEKISTMKLFPFAEEIVQRVPFEKTLDVVFAVPRLRHAWLIFSVTKEQLLQELAVNRAEISGLLLLDANGRILLSDTEGSIVVEDACQKMIAPDKDKETTWALPGGIQLIRVKSLTSGFQLGLFVSTEVLYGTVNRLSLLLYGFVLLIAMLSAGLLTVLSFWSARPIRELLLLAENLSDASAELSNASAILRIREILLSLQPMEPDENDENEVTADDSSVQPTVDEQAAEPSAHPLVPAEQTNKMISQVLAFLSETEHLGQMNVGEIAQHFHVEVSNLSHQFKDATGYTLSDYLNAKKLLIACQSLAETDEPITAIAERLGYQHTSSFARMFKKVYGVSPSAYRMRCREDDDQS